MGFILPWMTFHWSGFCGGPRVRCLGFHVLPQGLQCGLTYVDIPWLPPSHPHIATLVNEFVLLKEPARIHLSKPCRSAMILCLSSVGTAMGFGINSFPPRVARTRATLGFGTKRRWRKEMGLFVSWRGSVPDLKRSSLRSPCQQAGGGKAAAGCAKARIKGARSVARVSPEIQVFLAEPAPESTGFDSSKAT